MNKKLISLLCMYTLGVIATVAVTVKGIRSIADLKTEEEEQ